MELYETEFAVTVKADSSPVTEADKAAEAVILAGLAELAPGIPTVAEEALAAGAVPQTGSRFFLVDPLDGTKEFIRRNGEFTVNIALIENGAPRLGIVYAPALRRLYAGAVGEGAFFAGATREGIAPFQPIAVRPAPADLCVLASRSHANPETAAFLDRIPVGEARTAGSSLKFCLIAEGVADLYPRLGPTMEWDTAAGDAVLRAAGGHVTTFDGAPMTYGHAGRGFRNPWFIAAGDRRTIDRVVAMTDQDSRGA